MQHDHPSPGVAAPGVDQPESQNVSNGGNVGVIKSAFSRFRSAASSTVRQIFIATATISLLTIGVKIALMFREIVVAKEFGTADALEAFFIAFLLPSYIVNVVAGSFGAALVPTYIDIREKEGHTAAQNVFRGTVAVSTLILSVATLILLLVGGRCIPLLCSGFSAEKLLLTQRLFYVLLPVVIISGFATNWESVLNANERFAVAAVAPAAAPLAAIATLLLGERSWGIYALAFGTVFGVLIQLSVSGVALRRSGLKLLPRWPRPMPPGMKRVIGQYTPMVAGGALTCSSLVIDQSMATLLSSGSVASLNYGSKLAGLIVGLGAFPLATAVLPFFSKMVAASDWQNIRHTLKTYTRLILLITIPLTGLCCLASRPLATLLFQRGAFTAADTLVVSNVQIMFLLQVPSVTLGMLFVRMISALKANHILMWGTVMNCILNVGLNYLLMSYIGVAGIALSTSLVFLASCIFLRMMLNRKLKSLEAAASVLSEPE